MNTESLENKKNLSQDIYDEKLFKQAYKAAKQARVLEENSKKKKELYRILGVLGTVVLACIGVFLFFRFRKIPIEYIESNAPNTVYAWEEVNPNELDNVKQSILDISALSSTAFDPDTGQILFNKDIDTKRPIASITKLMSALVVLETYDLDEVITVSRENIPEDLDWQLELVQGDKISVEDLLEAMIISSYNDAAYIIANAYPYGGYNGFISRMNEIAKSLRMYNTSFSNPAGLDSEYNYSTAKDLTNLVSAVLNKSKILELASKMGSTVSWSSENTEIQSKKIYSTNQLYSVNKYIQGLKTGNTNNAKQCFVGYFVYPNGKRLITIVLGSEDRFTDTSILESYIDLY